MMTRRALVPFALSLCLAAPAIAGTVYVPLATDQTIDGVRYRTQVWLSNSASTTKSVTVTFIAAGTDGTSRPDSSGSTVAVEGRKTALLDPVVDPGQMGILEISGPDDVIVDARLTSTLDATTVGSPVPSITSENLFELGGTSHLQGWSRSDAVRTDFGIVNLSTEVASCTVRVRRASGLQIQSTVSLTVPPVSSLHFPDGLGALGETSVAGARSETTCDQPFSTYLEVYERGTNKAVFVAPSHDLGLSTLPPGGIDPTPPPPPPPPPPSSACAPNAVVCYTLPDTFYIPTPSQSSLRRTFAAPEGTYSSLHLQVEVIPAAFQKPVTGVHQIFWAARSARNIDLYGFVALRGEPKNMILWRHGFGLGAGDKPKIEEGFRTTIGATYIFDYLFDPKNKTIILEIRDADGNVLEHVIDKPNVNRVQIENGDFIAVDFSRQKGEVENEPPLYNWKFRNFLLEILP